MPDTGPPTPEEVAAQHRLPHQRVLMDLDFHNPSPNPIGGDPADLTDVLMTPIKSVITTETVTTIYSHRGDEEITTGLLAVRPDIVNVISGYADDYHRKGVRDFKMYHQTDEEVESILRSLHENPPQ